MINDRRFEFSADTLKTFENFCLFFEGGAINNLIEFLNTTRNHLLEIYKTGLLLPLDIVPDDSDFEDQIYRGQIKERLGLINLLLGEKRYYWDVFDPVDNTDKEAALEDISDDLEDIYMNIKNSLMLYSLGTDGARNTAMWQFEFHFRTHWGDHCISALRACHYLIKNLSSNYI